MSHFGPGPPIVLGHNLVRKQETKGGLDFAPQFLNTASSLFLRLSIHRGSQRLGPIHTGRKSRCAPRPVWTGPCVPTSLRFGEALVNFQLTWWTLGVALQAVWHWISAKGGASACACASSGSVSCLQFTKTRYFVLRKTLLNPKFWTFTEDYPWKMPNLRLSFWNNY